MSLEAAVEKLAHSITLLAAALEGQSTPPERAAPAPIASPTPPAQAATAPRGRGRPKADVTPKPEAKPEAPIKPFFEDAVIEGSSADPFGDDDPSTTTESDEDAFGEAEETLPPTRESLDGLFRELLSLEAAHPGARAAALEILRRYGAGKISQLQPSQFPAVIKDCQHLIRKTRG